MKLPNADQAIIPPEKIRDYLLSSSHPIGKFKAVFFKSIGYNEDNWQQLVLRPRSPDVFFGNLIVYAVRRQLLWPVRINYLGQF